MKKYLYIALLLLASALCAHAETILLRTGARVRGEIVFQNEEVVIVRDAEGKRFQYLRSDVEAVLTDDSAEVAAEVSEKEQELQTPKKASIILELAGGAAVQPQEYAGGAFSVDMLVGSHHIGDRHLFIGGGLGYHGLFLNGEKLNFLPIQVAIRLPFTETKHAPVFGFGLGYGVALSKDFLGGIYASADFGYRCQINPKTAIAVVAYTQFQQAKITVIQSIDDLPFSGKSGRNLVCAGVKLAFCF